MSNSSSATTSYRHRLGPHHFAYLRAIAEGLGRLDCAKRYLGIEHGHEAVTAHRLVVEQVRAAARRQGATAARLIGLAIRTDAPRAADRPSLDDFIAERGLDGWSEAEVAEMYEAAFPVDPKSTRRLRLRERQLELLQSLEQAVAQAPSPSDFVGGWFDEPLARKLVGAGFLTLGELNTRVSAGGAWYQPLPGIGRTKAARIETFLRTLLPRQDIALPYFGASLAGSPRPAPSPALPGSLLGNASVHESVAAWIAARANSEATHKVYAREVGRFLVWLRFERPGVTPATLSVQDAAAFIAFLREIPAKYISRRKATPGEIGWAPFRGQLKPGSRRQAVTVVASWLDWLVQARHIAANPFALVSKKQGDDQRERHPIKAFSEPAMNELLRFFQAAPPSPANHRMQFLLRFGEATGLRAAELLNARVTHLVSLPEGLALAIHGKGAKNRHVPLSRQARQALEDYLRSRGLDGIAHAAPDTPLLASAREPLEAISYSALYNTVRTWLTKAVRASALPVHEKHQLTLASTHWLRHTFGTRAIERGAAPDAVQETMGHSSPAMTARYTRANAKRQFAEIGKVFGE